MANPNTKEQARMLFFQANLSQKQIAEYVGVNQRTLFDWIKQGDWKRARAAATAAPAMLADSYYNQLARMSEFIEQRDERPFATKEESDIIRKLTMSVKQLGGTSSASFSELVQFCMLFSNFLQKRAPAISVQVVDAMDDFINSHMPGKQSYLKKVAAEKEIRAEYADYLNDLTAPVFPEGKIEKAGHPAPVYNNNTLNFSTNHTQQPPAPSEETGSSVGSVSEEKTAEKAEKSGSSELPKLTLKPEEKPAKSGSLSGQTEAEVLPVSGSIIPGLEDSEAMRYLRIIEAEANRQTPPIELPETPDLVDALEYAVSYLTPGYQVLREAMNVPEQQIDLLIQKFMLGEFNYNA